MTNTRIAIVTAPRYGRPLLFDTLADMRARDDVRCEVLVSSDTLYPVRRLPPGVGSACATLEQLRAANTQGGYDHRGPRLVNTFNWMRAADWATTGTDFAVILEDDLLFANEWLFRAKLMATSIVATGRPWALALMNVQKHDWGATPKGMPVRAPRDMHCPTCGVVVPSQWWPQLRAMLRKALAGEYFMDLMLESELAIPDHCLKLWNAAGLVDLHVAYPNLVQHVGLSHAWRTEGGSYPRSGCAMSWCFDCPPGQTNPLVIEQQIRAGDHERELDPSELYTDEFYDPAGVRVHTQSARVVLPMILTTHPAKNLVDVGCGFGAWCMAARECGVGNIVGIDGPWTPFPAGVVTVAHDLRNPIPIEGRFDLALCLEVAEHLPARRGPDLVRELCALSDVVVFSAATPGQGGVGHINERPESYWEALFALHGFQRDISVRKAIANRHDVVACYWANLAVYARRTCEDQRNQPVA